MGVIDDRLLLKEFFSLDLFAHASVFDKCIYVWEALENILPYLAGLKLGIIESEIPCSAYLSNPSLISIGKDTIVESGAFIQGPCIIGNGCQIRHGAYIRSGVITGDYCVIGHDTEIKHSILLDRASAAHFNYIGDSILGNGVNLGAGVKCANLRLDHQSVTVYVEGKKMDTQLKKLGAIVGDGSQIGCNCVTNPGTFLGKNSRCYPCLNVQGYIPENGKVKPAAPNIVE